MDAYENGAGFAGLVCRTGSLADSGRDEFRLPNPKFPEEEAGACCFRGPDERPKAEPSKSPNTSSLLDGITPAIPAVANLDAGDWLQLFPERSTPFD
jgi:hypothetical protein